MKGNHEFNATDIAPPACGGDRKRGQRPRQVNAKRSRQYTGNRPGNGHSTGIGQRSPGRKKASYVGLAPGDSLLRYERSSSGGANPVKEVSFSEAMDPRPLKYITAACAGEQLSGSPDELVQRLCTDSRKIQKGDLFFALPGEKFDGHNFVE